MAYSFSPTYEYVKGMVEASFFDVNTGELLYYTNKLQDTSVTTNINMGEITAGVGNGVVMNIPDSATLAVELTEASFSLKARGFQVGSNLVFNGVHMITEAVTATGTSITLPSIAVKGLGDADIYAYVGNDGTAYKVVGNVIQDFVAVSGDTYCIRYNIANPSAEQLDISSLFTPTVVRAVLKYPAYSTANADPMTGTLSAYYHVVIPRMQFGGNASIDGNQTTASTTSLNGSALVFDDSSEAACVNAAMPHLAYITRQPIGSTTQSVVGLAIVGGQIDMTAGDTLLTPVKLVMPDGALYQPDYTELTFDIPAGSASVATVAADGTITAVGAGTAELTVTLNGTAITTVNNVEVAGA